MKTLNLMALLCGALLLAGCAEGPSDAGPLRSETRAVGTFDAIDMQGGGRMEILVGSEPSLIVLGHDEALKRTTTEVRNGTLYIKNKHRDWIMVGSRQRVSLRIAVPSLQSLQLDGGNEVRLSGYNGGSSRIRVQGAASLRADGALDELTISMAGAGRADFSKVEALAAKVTVDGVGSVYVNSKESLDATMNGVGAIIYSGNPRSVNTAVNGLGTISQQKAHHVKKLEKRERKEEQRRQEGDADPDSLQLEREDQPKDVTEVI